MDNLFEIENCDNGVIIAKDDKKISIEKGSDGDIWFNSTNGNVELSLNYYSRNEDEWGNYNIFKNLMKSIIGRYILSDDFKNEYNSLPKDFINLDNKTITWHSDTGKDDTLQLRFGEKEIVVSMIKDNNRNLVSDNSIRVRIRTSGSNYGYYYQEFERFYNELSGFAYQVDSNKTPAIKKLSLFNK